MYVLDIYTTKFNANCKESEKSGGEHPCSGANDDNKFKKLFPKKEEPYNWGGKYSPNPNTDWTVISNTGNEPGEPKEGGIRGFYKFRESDRTLEKKAKIAESGNEFLENMRNGKISIADADELENRLYQASKTEPNEKKAYEMRLKYKAVHDANEQYKLEQ